MSNEWKGSCFCVTPCFRAEQPAFPAHKTWLAVYLLLFLHKKMGVCGGHLHAGCVKACVSISLLVLTGYLFYRAYQLWHRYQEATLNSLTRSIPYAFHIENYEEFFATHVTAGVVSAVIAVTLFLRRKLGATNTTPSLFLRK